MSDANSSDRPGEPIDGQRTVQRLVMRKRRRASPVAAVRLDSGERGAGRAEHAVELVPVLGRARRPGRKRELAKTVAECVDAHCRANVLANRAAVLRCRADEEHDEPAVDEAHVIVAAQQMPRHLGNGGKAGCRASRNRPLDRIHDSEQHRNGRLWRSRGYRGAGGGKELIRRSVEVGHDWEGTTRKTDVGSSWNGVRPEP